MTLEPDYLGKLAREWNLILSADAHAGLVAYVSRLLEWNVRINLTGAKSIQEVFSEHLVDSFALTRFLPVACSLADVGSGGGLPGIPLAILRPDIRITMVEPRAKRVAFLRSVSHELRLQNIELFRGRIEEVGPASFEACCSRATFPPPEWLELGRGLVKPGGQILVLANEPWAGSAPGARLIDAAQYQSGTGRSRWIGSFCFT